MKCTIMYSEQMAELRSTNLCTKIANVSDHHFDGQIF